MRVVPAREPAGRVTAAPLTRIPPPPALRLLRVNQNEIVKRLMWSGLLAGLGALSSVVTMRAAALIWYRIFDEDPPE